MQDESSYGSLTFCKKNCMSEKNKILKLYP